MDLMLLRAEGGEVWVKPSSFILITDAAHGAMITLSSGDKILAQETAETVAKKLSNWGNI